VGPETDGEKQSADLMKINRPDDLVDIVNLGDRARGRFVPKSPSQCPASTSVLPGISMEMTSGRNLSAYQRGEAMEDCETEQ
jgi:hypothetical protein